MTHQELFDKVRAIVPNDLKVSVTYSMKDWQEPEYGVTVFKSGDTKDGFVVYGKNPLSTMLLVLSEVEKLYQLEQERAA